MVRFRNRWIFFGRNWRREKPDSGSSVDGIGLRLIQSAVRGTGRIARLVSPGNLLLTFILRDVAHF